MLLAVAFLAGRGLLQKLAYFLFAFGIWDIGYYVALKIMLGWPASLRPATCSFSADAVVGSGVGAAACLDRLRRDRLRRAAGGAAAVNAR